MRMSKVSFTRQTIYNYPLLPAYGPELVQVMRKELVLGVKAKRLKPALG